MKKQTTTGADCSLIRPILLLILPFLPTLGPWGLLPVQAQQAAPPYPDVTKMIRESFDDYLDGTVACGWEALRHRMRCYIYQSNPGRLDAPKLAQFERLLVDDPEDVAAVNREMVAYCQRKTAEIEAAWRDPQRRHPAKEVCAYQTELIPLAILSLRIGERLTPQARQAIKEVLLAFRPETADVEPTLWMHAPGYNGANAHDYLSFLALTWAVTGEPEIRDAAYWGLRGELEHLNHSGDISEFNVLEAHWCGSNGYDAMKAFLRDPELARLARLIAERLWLNRFLMWSPVVERITGPGSRMAPGAWLGTSGDRLQFATGLEKPIWLNEFFDWGVWHLQAAGGRWPLDDVQGMVPDLPAYLQDVAWRKRFPNELRCSVQLIPWMKRYPKLPGIPDARPDPVLGEMVNYQTDQYALGSINHPYEASGCMAYASAWWNDSRARAEAPLGSPKRFAALYQDNYVGETSAGITDEQWVKARSGFVVEMGDATEYGSFERFRDVMLKAEVKETSDGFIRRIQYERPGRNLEMTWHCYEEDYLTRRINGRDHRTLRHLQCPEFAVGECELRTHDARLTTRAGETAWLLSAAPSRTYVAYQPNPHRQLPITLETPIGRIEAERFPFGKLVASRTANNTLELHIDVGFRPFWSSVHWRAQIWQDLGTHPGDILIQTDATEVTAVINGDKMPVMRERRNDQVVWILDPYARLPRVRDRSTVTVIPRSRSWLAYQAFEHECNDRHSSCKALHSK